MQQRVKVIGLWVILIVLFVAFYQIFSGPPGATPTPRQQENVSTFAQMGTWLPIVMLVAFGLFFVFFARRNSPLNDGVKLLGQGRYVQALEVFESFRKAFSNQPAGAYNCGVARLHLWKLESALLDFEAAKKISAGNAAILGVLLPEQVALANALVGRLGAARTALAEIPGDKGDPGRVGLAAAIISAREGQWANARSKLGSYEVKQMSGTVGALSRALDAWCIEQLTREARHIDRVALFGEASPDELKKHWPEFIAFVERAPAW